MQPQPRVVRADLRREGLRDAGVLRRHVHELVAGDEPAVLEAEVGEGLEVAVSTGRSTTSARGVIAPCPAASVPSTLVSSSPAGRIGPASRSGPAQCGEKRAPASLASPWSRYSVRSSAQANDPISCVRPAQRAMQSHRPGRSPWLRSTACCASWSSHPSPWTRSGRCAPRAEPPASPPATRADASRAEAGPTPGRRGRE